MIRQMDTEKKSLVRIIYDGDCPFCTGYVKMLRLKEHYEVELIDARDDVAMVEALTKEGFDLDDGMVVEHSSQYFHGDMAMNRLSLMTADSGLLRRVAKWVFVSEWRSRYLYPILRTGRNITLKLLGHKKIDNLRR